MQNQRGIALLVALILAVLLSLIGLSLTLASMSSIRMTSEFESHERALMIADAGQSAARTVLRGKSINTLLAQSTNIHIYLESDDTTPPDGSPSLRNPRLPVEARNIDFKLTPNPVGSRLMNGMLTPSLGSEIVVNNYTGLYFAKLTDNQDEAILPAPDDPKADLDGKVFLRVLGIDRTIANEVTSHGSYFKNAVAVVETVLKRDMTFQLNSPLALYGQNVSANFDGNSFEIDGYDHRGVSFANLLKGNCNHNKNEEGFSGIGCLYDASDQGDAGSAVEKLKDLLTKGDKNGEALDDNVIGQSERSDGTLAVNDDTDTVRNSDNPDAVNIFNPLFLLHFARMMGAVADTTFEDGADPKPEPAIFGTSEAPKIILAKGDLDISGSGSGAGILIVQGTLNITGAFEYEGIILVVGEGNLQLGGANKAIAGGVFVANIANDGTVGVPTISINGKCEFYMKSDSIEMAYSLLPMRVLAWREITSEIEPN